MICLNSHWGYRWIPFDRSKQLGSPWSARLPAHNGTHDTHRKAVTSSGQLQVRMAQLETPASTHQSWTGSVAVYVAKPPRAALYPTQGAPTGPTGGPDPAVNVLGRAAAAGASTQPTARKHAVLQSAPNKASLRGTWLPSQGAATLTAVLSAAGPGEFTVKVGSKRVWRQGVGPGGHHAGLREPARVAGWAGLANVGRFWRSDPPRHRFLCTIACGP